MQPAAKTIAATAVEPRALGKENQPDRKPGAQVYFLPQRAQSHTHPPQRRCTAKKNHTTTTRADNKHAKATKPTSPPNRQHSKLEHEPSRGPQGRDHISHVTNLRHTSKPTASGRQRHPPPARDTKAIPRRLLQHTKPPYTTPTVHGAVNNSRVTSARGVQAWHTGLKRQHVPRRREMCCGDAAGAAPGSTSTKPNTSPCNLLQPQWRHKNCPPRVHTSANQGLTIRQNLGSTQGCAAPPTMAPLPHLRTPLAHTDTAHCTLAIVKALATVWYRTRHVLYGTLPISP